MRKTTKIWLSMAASFVIIGCIIFTGVMSVLKWDFRKLSTVKYQTNHYEITEVFEDISIKTNTADIIFALSDDGKCKVECYEDKKAKHSVMVQENTLTINIVNEKSWYDYIGINFGSPKIMVYLPKTEYTSLVIKTSTGDIEIPKDFKFQNVDISLSTGDVDFYASASKLIKIKASTGDISLENMSAGSLDLSVSTGEITVKGANCEGDLTVKVSTGEAYLTDVNCNSVISSGSTGDINLKNVIAKERFSIKRSTGHVKFNGCDAGEITVETDTGDITGSLLSEKVFITKTSTGRNDVPNTVTGGKCEIKTDTGNIKITLK